MTQSPLTLPLREASIAEIQQILNHSDDEADILDFLERHKQSILTHVQRYRKIAASLDKIISNQREAQRAMQNSTFEAEEKQVEPMLIAGVRMKGKYCDCGKGFARIGKSFGRHICGKPFCLYYDSEYRENDADLEACMPIRQGRGVPDISVRELPGGRCVSLLHQGPYDELGRSYAKILDYIKQKGYQTLLPSREIYLKGPGMLLRGNPKRYLTEIQIFLAADAGSVGSCIANEPGQPTGGR